MEGVMPCNCNSTISFISGETKRLRFTATNPKVPGFVISQASYQITQNDVVVQNGVCDISGHDLTFLLSMTTKGFYEIRLTYKVGQEMLKAMFVMRVA